MNGSWWRRLVCWAQGHNLIGVDLPVSCSWQTCRTCGERVHAFRREARS